MLKQPIGQKRLTNIAVVRYRKMGKRFEIACYKNKVLNWRAGVEKDLDEVLQTETIFSNVGKGVLAKQEDLLEVFGTADERAICLKILADGDLQVSDKERRVELDALFRDVAFLLSEKCVNPTNNRPYTASMLERALRDAHFAVDPHKKAKQQLPEALALLQQRFPIERARMRLQVTAAEASRDDVLAALRSTEHCITESTDLLPDGSVAIMCQVDPGMFRSLNAMLQDSAGAKVEVVSLAVVGEGEQDATRPIPAHTPTTTTNNNNNNVTTSLASGYLPVMRTAAAAPHPQQPQRTAQPASNPAFTVIYPRGAIAALPDAHASRKARFEELDTLQPGWTVELRQREEGGVVDAVFFAPSGEQVGLYAAARRMALSHKS